MKTVGKLWVQVHVCFTIARFVGVATMSNYTFAQARSSSDLSAQLTPRPRYCSHVVDSLLIHRTLQCAATEWSRSANGVQCASSPKRITRRAEYCIEHGWSFLEFDPHVPNSLPRSAVVACVAGICISRFCNLLRLYQLQQNVTVTIVCLWLTPVRPPCVLRAVCTRPSP